LFAEDQAVKLIAALRPDADEITAVARAETDPARYSSFAPITAGPAVAVAALTAIGILGIVLAPIRLLKHIRSR
jgi:hypothetical protein